ncbi:autotransporter domain-containing protein [Sphingomonas sp.]|uniref:autotransporter domain-containing protein n=1 Tax=Sphingomonas sp. TaxID=28214 RepID=UPI00184DB57F|nr:autotransporter domain-containing protein [Sphingomonas sp.]MBA3511968.1 autotransporter domain-containing protein [Sphingomonas sp.]
MMNRVRTCLCLFLGMTALSVPAAAQRVDRIIAFGDSFADEGNAFELGLVPPQLVPLYPTGRFTGGTNYIDTLSQLLDAPVFNFAVGGARANPHFLFEVGAFAGGGGGVFPTLTPTFDEDDLITVSIGGNDARAYGSTSGATVGGAPAAAAPAIAATEAGLNVLVGAGAPTISFLAGDTGRLPEVAGDPTAAALRTAYSTAFNQGVQNVLAGYAANGVMVHYLDLTLVLNRVQADLAAFGLTGIACPAFATGNLTCRLTGGEGFLFYGDLLHPTSQGSAIIARYVATQLQAPLTLQATSDLALDTARQFGRNLTGRANLAGMAGGDVAPGMQLFVVGDTFSRDVDADDATDPFDIDGVGVTAGVSFGFAGGVAGIAANYSRPKAKFLADISDTKSTSWQVGAFAGTSIAGIVAQGYVGYGKDDHDIERGGVIDNLEAETDGSHWLAGAKAGYLMPMGGLRVGPVVALDYAKAKVDGYTEDGDAALTLNVDSISAKSLTGSLGLELRGDVGVTGVELRPFAAAALEKDFIGDGRTMHFSQTSAPVIVNRWELEDRSKKAYARLSGGGSAVILSGITLDAVVSGTLGRDDGDEVSAHIGLGIGF